MELVQIPPFSEDNSSAVIIALPLRLGLAASIVNSEDDAVTLPNLTRIGVLAIIRASSFAKLMCPVVLEMRASELAVHPIWPGMDDFQLPDILLDVSTVSRLYDIELLVA